MIKARIIADSLNIATGDRLTTYLLTFPRYILAEINTHRIFSRNSASSRAIPTKKFRDDVTCDPVIPVHWGANQKGMQAADELDDVILNNTWSEPCNPGEGFEYAGVWRQPISISTREIAKRWWLQARDWMVGIHQEMENVGLHKQIANRILEPWMWCHTLLSATEFENFFSLRCHKDAHPDIQVLADAMLKEYIEHEPKSSAPGDWHLPFGDQDLPPNTSTETIVKVCVARAARVSYKNFDGIISIEEDLKLHDRLLASGHLSPFEHVAQAMGNATWVGNFRSWLQLRKTYDNENRKIDLKKLYERRILKLETINHGDSVPT